MAASDHLTFVEYLNDPIWGEVPLTAVELDLINSKPFRRLQHIRQMGFAYLCFPTANHRRYEHCIGTMHVAYLLSDILSDIGAQRQDVRLDLGPAHFQALRLAALLHDIGHPPYSHAFEEVARKDPSLLEISSNSVFRAKKYKLLSPLKSESRRYSHELFTQHIVQNHADVSGIIEHWARTHGGFPAEQISLLAVGQANFEGLSIFNPVISGDFDADRIDYVCRDSYYCGFHQQFNLAELRRNLVVIGDGKTEPFGLELREGSIPAITTLLWYRYRLMKAVHLHPQNRIATQVFIDTLAHTLENRFKFRKKDTQLDREKLDLLIDIHTQYTDEQCNDFLAESVGSETVSDLIHGRLPEEVYSIGRRHLTPEEKVFLHFILQETRQIPILQKKLSDRLGFKVLADLRVAKSPRFEILVSEGRDGDKRSIFDNYFTPHGIMIDSANTLTLYLYHPNKSEFDNQVQELSTSGTTEPFRYPVKPVRFMVYKSIEEAYDGLRKEWEESKRAFSLEFLVSLLGSLDELSSAQFSGRLWATGDGRLQVLIHAVVMSLSGRLEVRPEYQWTDTDYSVRVFQDFEVLQNVGLVDHVHTPVGGPGTRGAWIGQRIDRQLSTFGLRYYHARLKGTYHQSLVHQEVATRFEKAFGQLEELIRLEEQLEEVGLLSEHRDATYESIERCRRALTDEHRFAVLSRRFR